MMVVETILVAFLLFGMLLFIVGFQAPTSDSPSLRQDVLVSGEDAIAVLNGLPACELLTGGEKARCTDVYGASLLNRILTESLTGDTDNLTTRLRSLMPDGVTWNLFLFNGLDSVPIYAPHGSPEERVSTTVPFRPAWNMSVLVPHLDRYNWTASGENAMRIHVLPTTKSNALFPLAGDNTDLVFGGGNRVNASTVTVASDRGHRDTLAHWRFNEGSGTTAADAKAAFGLTVDSANWRTGRVGSSLHFDAPADALTAGPDAALTSEQVTLQAWVYPEATPPGDARLVAYDSGDGDTLELRLEASTRAVIATLTTGAGTTTLTGDAAALDTWTHVTVTTDRNDVTLYINGTRAATDATPGPMSTGASASLLLGGKRSGGDPDTYVLEGRLDDVRAYGRALDAGEFSRLRVVDTPPARLADVGWEPATGRNITSESTWNRAKLNGSTTYEVDTAALLANAAPSLLGGLNDSFVAAYANTTGWRAVPLGDEVAIQFDFQPAIDRLAADGYPVDAGAAVWTTVSVQAPVPHPPGDSARVKEVVNRSVQAAAGYVNVTLPRTTLLGAHAVIATVNLTLDGAPDVGVLLRAVDYLEAVLPGSRTPPLDPVYRVTLELWVPEWR